jgi:hypothetical protein
VKSLLTRLKRVLSPIVLLRRTIPVLRPGDSTYGDAILADTNARLQV